MSKFKKLFVSFFACICTLPFLFSSFFSYAFDPLSLFDIYKTFREYLDGTTETALIGLLDEYFTVGQVVMNSGADKYDYYIILITSIQQVSGSEIRYNGYMFNWDNYTLGYNWTYLPNKNYIGVYSDGDVQLGDNLWRSNCIYMDLPEGEYTNHKNESSYSEFSSPFVLANMHMNDFKGTTHNSLEQYINKYSPTPITTQPYTEPKEPWKFVTGIPELWAYGGVAEQVTEPEIIQYVDLPQYDLNPFTNQYLDDDLLESALVWKDMWTHYISYMDLWPYILSFLVLWVIIMFFDSRG